MAAERETTYLGDGVYAATDGYHIWLLTNSHDQPTDKVALEPEVYQALVRFAAKLGWTPQ